MSLERIIKTLEGFGLKRMDAEVYIYLAKKGPLEVEEVANSLRLSRQKVCRILQHLENKGMITIGSEHQTLVSAVVFERALELLVKANIEQAKAIRETREELLSNWRKMIKRDNT